jgi:hypothetical protein
MDDGTLFRISVSLVFIPNNIRFHLPSSIVHRPSTHLLFLLFPLSMINRRNQGFSTILAMLITAFLTVLSA